MKKLLVTGGAGLIGSNLVKVLSDHSQYQIKVVDNLWRGRKENLVGSQGSGFDIEKDFLELDLSDYANCEFATRDVDLVVHLADIVAGIDYVFRHQYFLFQKNIQINSNLLNAAIKNNVDKILYVGTACSYPASKQREVTDMLLREEDAYPAEPETAYGWSKLMGEYEIQLATNDGLIESSILRLHNVYGPPCEIDPRRSQVIPALCRKAVEYPEAEFIVWGSGQQRRAFVFVTDVVDAIVLGINHGFGHGVIQIGASESIAISQIAEQIVRISEKDIEIKYDESRPEGDVDRKADYSKAKDVLGWEPKVGIDEGLTRTYRWVSRQLKNLVND